MHSGFLTHETKVFAKSNLKTWREITGGTLKPLQAEKAIYQIIFSRKKKPFYLDLFLKFSVGQSIISLT